MEELRISWLSSVPEWIGTALVGATFAAIGYMTKELLDRRKKKNLAVEENISNLKSLFKMLIVQKRIFDIQCIQRNKLFNNLSKVFPAEVQNFIGYDETFEKLYGKFSDEDLEIHTIIRSQTKGSLLPLNKKIQELADKIDTELLDIKLNEKKVLKDQLENLVLHLIMWLAKYEDWIPNYPRHALVYLADEKEHGVGFPTGIEKLVGSIFGNSRSDTRCSSCRTVNDLDAVYCKKCGNNFGVV